METEETGRAKRGLASATEETRVRWQENEVLPLTIEGALRQRTSKLGCVWQRLEEMRDRTIETVCGMLGEKEERALKQSMELNFIKR